MILATDNKTHSEIFDFCQFWLKFTPHFYQSQFLDTCIENNRVVSKWARQSGKSFSVAAYLTYRVVMSEVVVVIVAPTQNQSDELYKKIRAFINKNDVLKLLITKDTASEMLFANGSRIISLPEGNEGKSIRGFTADIIVIEEAGIVSDNVMNQVIAPMIASKPNGQIIKIGTPLGKNHFYQSCYDKNSKYKLISVTWRECIEAGQYNQDFVDEQQSTLLPIEFTQEYEAEFVEDDNAYFSYVLIKTCQTPYDYWVV